MLFFVLNKKKQKICWNENNGCVCRVTRESLKAGDHIYSWRTAYIYAHHGVSLFLLFHFLLLFFLFYLFYFNLIYICLCSLACRVCGSNENEIGDVKGFRFCPSLQHQCVMIINQSYLVKIFFFLIFLVVVLLLSRF